MNPRAIGCRAVFTDDWSWPFNPKNPRSKRQRFANSGENISGFTAIFCDDWKDYKEDEAHLYTFEYPRLESSQNDQCNKSCKRKRDTNDIHNYKNFPELLSTPSLCKRQHRQQSSLETETTKLPPTRTNWQNYQARWLDSDTWLSQSPATLKSITPSSTMSEASSRGPATPCYSTLGIPNLEYPIPIDITSQTKTEWDECLASEEDGSKIGPSMLTDLTVGGRGRAVLSTKEIPDCNLFQTYDESMENKGLDYWCQLLECNNSLQVAAHCKPMGSSVVCKI